MAFITLMVVRVSCQISQNAAVEAALEPGLPLGAVLPVAAGLLLAAVLPLGAVLPQADSARARTAVSNGMARNTSRLVVREVRFMPVVDEGKPSD
jgi:hypothetical protein